MARGSKTADTDLVWFQRVVDGRVEGVNPDSAAHRRCVSEVDGDGDKVWQKTAARDVEPVRFRAAAKAAKEQSEAERHARALEIATASAGASKADDSSGEGGTG